MLETHPFGSFVPKGAKYLILGSFTTKEAFINRKRPQYKWFYANGGRNQFWPILEVIYKVSLQTRKDMQNLLTKKHFAIADIIYKCERKNGNNLDNNLVNITYAVDAISKILANKRITRIFFTSRFVEKKFRSEFKHLMANLHAIKLITLPSPSPRYALMTRKQKIKVYKRLLPVD